MLEHVIDRVRPLQPDRLVFITGYLGDQIEAWARETYGNEFDLAFVVQPEMKGQTDAIVRTRHLAPTNALVLFPDMLFEADFTGLRETTHDAVMFTKHVEDPSALGVAVVGNDGFITKLVEKPSEPISKLAVIGIYYFREMTQLYDAIDEQMRLGISLKNEYFIADAMQLMINAGCKISTAPVSEWEDCGSVANLLATNRWQLDRMNTPAVIREGSVILQPSVIAESALIEGSVVGPHASIGDGVVIRDSIIRESVVEAKATIEHAIVEKSLIGRRARVHGSISCLNIGDDSGVSA